MKDNGTFAEEVEELLENPLYLTSVDEYGNTPLHSAWQLKDNETLWLLVETCRKLEILNHQNKYGETALMKAVMGNNYLLVKLLLYAGADVTVVDSDGDLILLDYTIDDKEVMKLLVQKCAKAGVIDNVNICGRTALINAVICQDDELIKVLLEEGANVAILDQFGKIASDYATAGTIKQLLLKEQDVTQDQLSCSPCIYENENSVLLGGFEDSSSNEN